VTPPAQDGTCGPQEAPRSPLARILAQGVVFGCFFVLSAGVFCAVYALVWLYRR
jgi:hypothetical protein